MSLISLALRIITVKALTNATLAGARVFDSAVDPIDQKALNEASAVIVVYTDEDKQTVTGRDLLNAQHDMQLSIEFACAQAVQISVGDGPDDTATVYEIPHTDAGLEVTLNLMRRQALRALLADQGIWPTLWREFALSISTVISRRGAGSEKGVRYAAQQVVITTETLSEPGFGGPAEGSWQKLIAALEADSDPGLRQIAKLIRAEIEMPDLPTWRRAIADLGVNASTGDAIGIVPVLNPTAPDDTGVPLESIEIKSGDETLTVDAQSINEAIGPDENESVP